jgi:hypothetical protein
MGGFRGGVRERAEGGAVSHPPLPADSDASRRAPSVPLGACAALVGLALSGPSSSAEVREYRTARDAVFDCVSGRPAVALRLFSNGGSERMLVLDPETLTTRVCPADSSPRPGPWRNPESAIAATPYGRALADARQREGPLEDAAIDHVRAPRAGIDLTIDLCPSHRPLDRVVFTDLIADLGTIEQPAPVAIAVTGLWLEAHAEDLAWLVGLERAGRLAITWINHSFHHRVDPRAPLERNFLLEPGTNLTREVLDTEVAMITRNLTPSVFFRFPGLVSARSLVESIVGFGLIPVGSDAWLAKGQQPGSGSVVLIHANGNEPLGVERFRELLRKEREAVRQRRWLLLDLRETVAESEWPPRP